MKIIFELKQTFECPICLQLYDRQEAKKTASKVLLFGSAKYAVCIGCGQPVEDQDAGYRRRYDDRFYQRRERGQVYAHVG